MLGGCLQVTSAILGQYPGPQPPPPGDPDLRRGWDTGGAFFLTSGPGLVSLRPAYLAQPGGAGLSLPPDSPGQGLGAAPVPPLVLWGP